MITKESLRIWAENTLYTKNGRIIPFYLRNGILEKKFGDYNAYIFKYTSFLSIDSSTRERIHCIKNDINSLVLCNCGKIIKLKGSSYTTYCSPKCAQSNKNVRDKIKKTNLEKYGSDNPFGSPQIKEKIKQTNIEKYGVEYIGSNIDIKEKIKKTNLEKYGCHPLQLDEIRNKIKQTNIEKYGTNVASKSTQVKDKIKKTNLERYGVECTLSSSEIKDKIKKTNLERYGTEITFQSEEIKEKIKKTMISRYGVENISQSDEIKQKKKETCMKNYGVTTPLQSNELKEKLKLTSLKKYGVDHPSQSDEIKEKKKKSSIEKYGVDHPSQKHISEESLKFLNDINWLIEQHHIHKKTLEQIAIELGVCGTSVGRYFRNYDIEIKKIIVSQAERDIISFLKEYYLGEIIGSDRKQIKPLELDIYLPELNLAIEYCGLYWHSHIYKDKNYHLNKLKLCKEKNIKLITIFEDEWIHKQDIVKSKLLNIMNQSSQERLYARKCSISTPTIDERRNLLNEHHIQGDAIGSINLGLYHEQKLVSVMTFKNMKNGVYDLNRFASSVNVVGGFSKLLSYFKKTYNYKEIISFADKRWSEGNIYLKNGFEHVYNTRPDYKYIIGDQLHHKFGFRHKHLKNKLENYDPNLSEFENTENHGINRIYDCGLMKFSITNIKN